MERRAGGLSASSIGTRGHCVLVIEPSPVAAFWQDSRHVQSDVEVIFRIESMLFGA